MKEGLYSFSTILVVFIVLTSLSTAQDDAESFTRGKITQLASNQSSTEPITDPEILLDS